MSKPLTNQVEHRIFTTELRASTTDNPQTNGYAAVFNTIIDLGWYKEQIAQGTFTRAIAEKQDIRALFNHNPDHVLGRTKSNTLALSEDNTGLRFSCDMPDTQTGRDVYTLVQRGDVDQCSFGFIVRDEKVTYDADGNALRTIKDADLFDVSIVTYPAYESTSVEARSRDAAAQTYKRNVDDTAVLTSTPGIHVSDSDEPESEVISIETARLLTYLAKIA
jgi:Escherichia/Staphylococcus phage prohead protease